MSSEISKKRHVTFLLNARAKKVSKDMLSRLCDITPAGDLYYARSLAEAETFLRQMVRTGVNHIFSGGGDGTFVQTLHALRRIATEEGLLALPKVGVLKLGTGNAMASMVRAGNPIEDVYHMVHGGDTLDRVMPMVQCDDGIWTPFAGLGLDGELIHDYMAMKNIARGTPAELVMKSLMGFFCAGLWRTAPRMLSRKAMNIKVRTLTDAYHVVQKDGQEVDLHLPPGSVIYEGPSFVATVGSIPLSGYKMVVFPHAQRREGFLHLRIGEGRPLSMALRLYPGIWNGTFRHPLMHEFLVKDVEIECDYPAYYQVAGDARGLRNMVRFQTAKAPLAAVELAEKRIALPASFTNLLPLPSFA
jgi:diacylglycerol kinase family enzyme